MIVIVVLIIVIVVLVVLTIIAQEMEVFQSSSSSSSIDFKPPTFENKSLTSALFCRPVVSACNLANLSLIDSSSGFRVWGLGLRDLVASTL